MQRQQIKQPAPPSKKFDNILETDNAEHWTTQQYNEELVEFLNQERKGLIDGATKLYGNIDGKQHFR